MALEACPIEHQTDSVFIRNDVALARLRCKQGKFSEVRSG